MRLFTVLFILFALISCKRLDPQPELSDPIYSDLQHEYSRHVKMAEEIQKEADQLKAELDASEVRTIDKKIRIRDLGRTEERLRKAKEGSEYFRIRVELRRVYARKAYREAFDKGERWPDPAEYDAYKVNKTLRNASLNWSLRVPKLSHVAQPPAEPGQLPPEDALLKEKEDEAKDAESAPSTSH